MSILGKQFIDIVVSFNLILVFLSIVVCKKLCLFSIFIGELKDFLLNTAFKQLCDSNLKLIENLFATILYSKRTINMKIKIFCRD